MPQDQILLGHQEYLIQTTEKELFYIKVAFYGSMQIVMPSDRLAPTSGGIRYTGFSSETVSKIPLAQYEQTVAKQAVMERGMLSYGSTSTGRLNESSIIFDAIFFVMTWGGSSVVTKAFSALNLIGNIASAASTATSIEGSIEDKLVEELWKKLVRKFARLDSDLLFELLTAGTGHVIGQLKPSSDNKKTLTPSEVLLRKIQSFRFAVDRPRFQVGFDLLVKAQAPGR